jgi:hypothetical protein
MSEITLDFIARQLERLVNDVASLRDDMSVVMARIERVDGSARRTEDTVRLLTDEIRAMHGRHDRLARRVGRLEAEEPA